jgi:hypothetical protein
MCTVLLPPGGNPIVVYKYTSYSSTLSLTSVLDVGGWVVKATPQPFYPRERPGTHCIRGWVGAGLDGRYCSVLYITEGSVCLERISATSYTGGPEFKHRLGSQLFWPEILVIFLNYYRGYNSRPAWLPCGP